MKDFSEDFFLERTPAGLELCKLGERGGVLLTESEISRRLKQGRKLLLARACSAAPGVTVFDATGGFGLDGLTLAALGCEVTLCERHPLVFELLEDGIRRLGPPATGPGAARVLFGDAATLLASSGVHEVVYLDPIFPERGKTALPSKRARFLAELVGPEDGSLEELLALARQRARKRVVIKRRRHDPTAGRPDFALEGRSVRFDVYLPGSSG